MSEFLKALAFSIFLYALVSLGVDAAMAPLSREFVDIIRQEDLSSRYYVVSMLLDTVYDLLGLLPFLIFALSTFILNSFSWVKHIKVTLASLVGCLVGIYLFRADSEIASNVIAAIISLPLYFFLIFLIKKTVERGLLH